MTKHISHESTWAKIRARAALDHDHADEHYHSKSVNDNEGNKTILPSREIHDHDDALKAKMQQIQNFVNRDAECVFALKHYQGLEKGVLVNACKGLGTAKTREVLVRVRNKPQERLRKSKGEYVTGALKMEVRNKGLEWGEWSC